MGLFPRFLVSFAGLVYYPGLPRVCVVFDGLLESFSQVFWVVWRFRKTLRISDLVRMSLAYEISTGRLG